MHKLDVFEEVKFTYQASTEGLDELIESLMNLKQQVSESKFADRDVDIRILVGSSEFVIKRHVDYIAKIAGLIPESFELVKGGPPTAEERKKLADGGTTPQTCLSPEAQDGMIEKARNAPSPLWAPAPKGAWAPAKTRFSKTTGFQSLVRYENGQRVGAIEIPRTFLDGTLVDFHATTDETMKNHVLPPALIPVEAIRPTPTPAPKQMRKVIQKKIKRTKIVVPRVKRKVLKRA